MSSIGIFSYLPWLLVFAVIFGLINGYIIIQLTKLRVFKNV